jgi:hypothetical protein
LRAAQGRNVLRRWIPTRPGGGWEIIFRFYGPQKPLFEKTWRLRDIERIAAQ